MAQEEASWSKILRDSTAGERCLTLFAGGVTILAALACAAVSVVEWESWQWALVLFVAFDLGGGVAAMCLSPVIRKVRPVEEPLKPLLFAAVHVHPLFLAIALPQQDWRSMAVLYAAGLAGVTAAGLAPGAYRASVSLAWCAAALPVIQLLGLMPGLAWLAPVFLLKLVGSHAATVQEEKRP